MAAVNNHSDFGAQENISLSLLPLSDGTRCHDLSFLNVEFKPVFHSPLSPSLSLVPLRFLT